MVMKIKYILAASAALCLVQLVATAQDLDPTVVVNKAYEGRLIQVHKPALEMEVPDSVTRFDLDFDYLVSDRPYKGADGFNPYVLTMKPASMVQEPMKLYVNAGAGYTLHPTLDVVWSPLRSRSFKMDVYALHRSYVGDYRSFRPVTPANGEILTVDRWRESGGDQAHWMGYDFLSKAGVDGRYERTELSAMFDVSYYGLASKDLWKRRMYDALDVKLGVSSKPGNSSYFKYDVDVAYRFAEDKIKYNTAVNDYLGEHVFNVDAVLGQVMGEGHQVMFDVDMDLAAYTHDALSSVVGQLELVPRYVFKKGRWTLDAGIRLAKVMRPESAGDLFGAQEQIVYPDVKAWFSVVPDAMRLYAFVGGGNKINTYASLLEENHHLDTTYGLGRYGLMDVSVERVSASLGLEGRIGSIFSYDLRTGYVNYGSALLDAVAVAPAFADGEVQYLPGVGYASYQKYFAALDWCLGSESLRFDGNVMYTYAWGLQDSDGLFAPAALTGDISFEYNWSRRIYAGIDCQFSTARKGSVTDDVLEKVYEAKIPGYADLGVYFEYACSRVLSVWARGGNLLNMTIQRNPLFAEKGANVTVGICLNL
jgi:hypothetical protein